VIGLDDDRRVVVGDDCRPGDGVAGSHLRAVVDRRLVVAVVEEDLLCADFRLARVLAAEVALL
jgi:hypothetical protein